MNWIMQHPLQIIAGYYVYSAAVGSMPAPTDKSSTFYIWVHGFLHILAGNLSAAVAAKFPALPAGAVSQTSSTSTVIMPPDPANQPHQP